MATTRVVTRLEGYDDVRRALQRVPDQTRALLSDVIAKTTFAVKQRAVVLAPRDTGRLRNAITASSRGLYGRVVISDPLAFYWRFVEYGTRTTAARPFVRASAELETSALVDRVRQAGERLEKDWKTGGGLL